MKIGHTYGFFLLDKIRIFSKYQEDYCLLVSGGVLFWKNSVLIITTEE
jgi:hypothetical protein